MDEDYQPTFQTKRFDIFEVQIYRNPEVGSPRDVFMAWFRDEDIPRSVCEVTLFGGFVEWVHVCEQYRRQGIATEVLRAIEGDSRYVEMEGATESGTAFVESYYSKQI